MPREVPATTNRQGHEGIAKCCHGVLAVSIDQIDFNFQCSICVSGDPLRPRPLPKNVVGSPTKYATGKVCTVVLPPVIEDGTIVTTAAGADPELDPELDPEDPDDELEEVDDDET